MVVHDKQNRTPVRRVTLEDVAKQAGVSRAMASLVIREEPGPTSMTRLRVLAAARMLDYRPDRRARSLASPTSRLIGVTFGGAGHFHFDLLEGLYAAAADHGYDLILSAVTPERGEQQALDSLADFRFDGLVMLGPPVAQPAMAGTIPMTVMGWSVDHESVDVVRTSDEHGMALAVNHLADLGHRRIAHLDGGRGLVANARREAYIRAMGQRGLGGETMVVSGGEDSLDGLRAAGELLAAAELPTAVVAFNDDTAAAAVSLFAREGIDVPGGISVVGWDDSHLAHNPAFDLTSVAQRPHEMARAAIERIVARCDGLDVQGREIVLEPTLVVRSSTGRPPAMDR